jgi:hypothetical protein
MRCNGGFVPPGCPGDGVVRDPDGPSHHEPSLNTPRGPYNGSQRCPPICRLLGACFLLGQGHACTIAHHAPCNGSQATSSLGYCGPATGRWVVVGPYVVVAVWCLSPLETIRVQRQPQRNMHMQMSCVVFERNTAPPISASTRKHTS